MDEYPGNPATNKLGAGVTDDDILKAIQASGYVLQSVAVDRIIDSALDILRRSDMIGSDQIEHRFRFQEEWPYVDSDSGDTRTLDALISIDMTDDKSRKPVAQTPAETFYFHVDMLVECKQSDLPYIFFMRPTNAGDVPYLAGLPHEWLSIQEKGEEPEEFAVNMRPYDLLGIFGLPLAELPPTAISMSKARRQGKSLELSGEDAFRGLSLPLYKAAQYYYKRIQSSDPVLYAHVRLVLVLAVVRAPMIGVSMEDGEIATKALPWVRLVRVDPATESLHSKFSKPTAIDVVHIDYLAEYTKIAMESCLDVVHWMTRFANPLLSGLAAFSIDGEDDGTADSSGGSATEEDEPPPYESMRPVISDEQFMTDWADRFARHHSTETEDEPESPNNIDG